MSAAPLVGVNVGPKTRRNNEWREIKSRASVASLPFMGAFGVPTSVEPFFVFFGENVLSGPINTDDSDLIGCLCLI